MTLQQRIEEALCSAVRTLPAQCEALIRKACDDERSTAGRSVLSAIVRNIDMASSSTLPLCQDCGMFLCFVEVGRDSHADVGRLEGIIIDACMSAAHRAYYRSSVVAEPVYDRVNTGDNLPPVIHWEVVEGGSVRISFLLKGFGSENCSSVRMIRPTDGEEGVVGAVLDMVRAAGGKPCPPMFLGVGIGGTMDKAAVLSKKALLREAASRHQDERYARLEERLLDEVNRLGIGPGGLGGDHTCLSVCIETYPTHIAGLPVALSVNCWAERKAVIEVTGGEVW